MRLLPPLSQRKKFYYLDGLRWGGLYRGYSPDGKRLSSMAVPAFVMPDYDNDEVLEHWLFAFDSDDSLRPIGRDVLRLSARCGLNYSQAIDEVWK